MKKAYMAVGIILIIVGVLALAWAGINRFSFYHTLDGSNELYSRLKWQMKVSFAIGLPLLILGILDIVFLVGKKK